MVNFQKLAFSMYDDVDRFFDAWNTIGAICVSAIALILLLLRGPTTQSVLVIVTTIYAFITFNQMREARWNRRPASSLAVWPSFIFNSDTGEYDLGLQNFGDSPALGLRLRAKLKEGDATIDTLDISGKDQHLHLEQGEFVSLTSGTPGFGSWQELADPDDDIYENAEQKYIEFYYTFEATNGVQYPRGMQRPQQMDIDEVVKIADNPRTVRLTEILQKCAGKGH